jgi:hypothetical protein
LNAAHASATALAHAAPNSEVGKVAAYKSAVADLNATNAALAASNTPATQSAQAVAQAKATQALATAANKAITTSTVTSLNSTLGISLSAPTTASSLAAQAASLQSKC